MRKGEGEIPVAPLAPEDPKVCETEGGLIGAKGGGRFLSRAGGTAGLRPAAAAVAAGPTPPSGGMAPAREAPAWEAPAEKSRDRDGSLRLRAGGAAAGIAATFCALPCDVRSWSRSAATPPRRAHRPPGRRKHQHQPR